MAQMTGGRFIAETVHGYGISHVFFMPYIGPRAMMEMEKLGIKRVQTHGEKAAAYMADAYARVKRGPGLCMAQSVGAVNLAAGLQDAFLACSPVIALTGRELQINQQRHAYQEVDPGPNFVGCKNEFVIRRILAVCESSGMSASWGKREERIFPFRGGVQGGSRRVGARRGRTGALARWCPDARPGWGGRRLSVWLVRGALARRRGGVWRSADGLGGGTRSAL